MRYELLVKSTMDDRFNGTIKDKVKTALAGDVSITYVEGGTDFSGDEPVGESNFGLDTSDEVTARAAAVKVAKAVGSDVAYYEYGRDVDPMTAARFVAKPTDSEV